MRKNDYNKKKTENKNNKIKIIMRGTFQKYRQLIIFQNGVVVGRINIYYKAYQQQEYFFKKNCVIIARTSSSYVYVCIVKFVFAISEKNTNIREEQHHTPTIVYIDVCVCLSQLLSM